MAPTTVRPCRVQPRPRRLVSCDWARYLAIPALQLATHPNWAISTA
ncbi:hypothetical protein [Streptomyces mirabilis]